MIDVKNTGDNNFSILLGERFDFSAVEGFRKSYESIELGANAVVTFDFTNTKYMDSSALGMLINARSYLTTNGAKPLIANCNEQISRIFSISRFDKKFDIV